MDLAFFFSFFFFYLSQHHVSTRAIFFLLPHLYIFFISTMAGAQSGGMSDIVGLSEASLPTCFSIVLSQCENFFLFRLQPHRTEKTQYSGLEIEHPNKSMYESPFPQIPDGTG